MHQQDGLTSVVHQIHMELSNPVVVTDCIYQGLDMYFILY